MMTTFMNILSTIPPEQQVWGDTEDLAVVIFLIAAVILTLALVGLFAYIIMRGNDDPGEEQ